MDPELAGLYLNLRRAVEAMLAEADYDHDRGHQYIVGKTVYQEVELTLSAIHEYRSVE
jgi:hypothetical protein